MILLPEPILTSEEVIIKLRQFFGSKLGCTRNGSKEIVVLTPVRRLPMTRTDITQLRSATTQVVCRTSIMEVMVAMDSKLATAWNRHLTSPTGLMPSPDLNSITEQVKSYRSFEKVSNV